MYSSCKIIAFIYLSYAAIYIWIFAAEFLFPSQTAKYSILHSSALPALQWVVPVFITPLRHIFGLDWKQQREFLCSSLFLCPEVNIINKLCRVLSTGYKRWRKQQDPLALWSSFRAETTQAPAAGLGHPWERCTGPERGPDLTWALTATFQNEMLFVCMCWFWWWYTVA